ncbi:hypothetical protein FO488_15920 [Geobacter sp. FeAm09]|uniref:hypothetical protein n=1 Tax=Geobacter sp. FeAm09 TaxID=2597769 RepID=UPI0011EE00D3|nr:hypothetical protein [Geobacter sp. FeAm09]QEM69495.1 hypothetical protein FO488_15920 [Geobacter sp. FeAm09]
MGIIENWTWKGFFEAVQAIGVVGGLCFAGYQLHLQTKTMQDAQQVNSATFVLKISDEFDKPKFQKLMDAIDDHASTFPIIKKFDGKLTEDYIGNFETLGNLVDDGIISEQMAYDELSYELEKAWCNNDIQRLIKKNRGADNLIGRNAMYSGFEHLAKRFLMIDHKTCSDIEKE